MDGYTNSCLTVGLATNEEIEKTYKASMAAAAQSYIMGCLVDTLNNVTDKFERRSIIIDEMKLVEQFGHPEELYPKVVLDQLNKVRGSC